MLYKTLFHIIAAAAGLLSVQAGEASVSCPVPSFQDSSVLEDFVEKVSVSAVSFNYEYVVDDGRARITGGGSIDMQGEAYLMNGDGLEVFCDGRTRWTVDRQSREVVVESYDPGQPDYTVNPAVLIQKRETGVLVVLKGQIVFRCRKIGVLRACMLDGRHTVLPSFFRRSAERV